jgi:hypothetical protein
MTVVLQHRFWDLAVHDDYFEVKLTFDSIPERLVVPFEAIKVFFDPSVRYGLQFEEVGFTTEAIDQSMVSLDELQDDEATIERFPSSDQSGVTGRQASNPQAANPQTDDGDGANATGTETGALPAPSAPGSDDKHADGQSAATASGEDEAGRDSEKGPREAAGSGAEIVSLDAFRKK